MALVAGAVAYAGLLASTTPFTLEADAVTAVALAAAVAVLLVRLTRGRTLPAGAAAADVSPGGASALPWVVLVAVVAVWELYCFFGGPRPAHPTLSTVYDLAARWPAAKAVVVLAWLALGWELLR
ncbi:MAG: hypothetical protein ACLP62_12720 [Acidimicrobiales bacterium]